MNLVNFKNKVVMNISKKVTLIINLWSAFLIFILFLSCTVRSPAPIFNIKTDAEYFNTMGQSSSYRFIGIFAWGDASLTEALRDGGIVKVHHIDNEIYNFLGIYQRYSTIVYGTKSSMEFDTIRNQKEIDSLIRNDCSKDAIKAVNTNIASDYLYQTFKSKFKNKEGFLDIYRNKIIFHSNSDTIDIFIKDIKELKPSWTELCYSIKFKEDSIATFCGIDNSFGESFEQIKKAMKRHQ
jgi:TRL-like protein family